MDLFQSVHDFREQVFANPSPWFGGMLSGVITAGIFGWITHVRSVRPVLVFLYKHGQGWFLKNIGPGPAVDIVVADASDDKKWVIPTLYYPLAAGDEQHVMGIQHGEYLGTEYTDIHGHRYSTICGFNKNLYSNHWVHSLFRRHLPKKTRFGIVLRKIGELEAVELGRMSKQELAERILKRKTNNDYEKAV